MIYDKQSNSRRIESSCGYDHTALNDEPLLHVRV